MLIYLVRHGETALNAQGIVQGHLDPPLSPAGYEQAEKLGRYLSGIQFTEVQTSDLLRAKQTAAYALREGLQCPIIPSPHLRARQMGSLQGLPYPSDGQAPLDMESVADVEARIASWLSDLIAVHKIPSDLDIGCSLSSTSARRVIATNFTGNGEDRVKIMVITHQECLSALLSLMKHPAASPIFLAETDSNDTDRWMASTALSVLRVWQGPKGPCGKFESWGTVDHLDEGDSGHEAERTE